MSPFGLNCITTQYLAHTDAVSGIVLTPIHTYRGINQVLVYWL